MGSYLKRKGKTQSSSFVKKGGGLLSFVTAPIWFSRRPIPVEKGRVFCKRREIQQNGGREKYLCPIVLHRKGVVGKGSLCGGAAFDDRWRENAPNINLQKGGEDFLLKRNWPRKKKKGCKRLGERKEGWGTEAAHAQKARSPGANEGGEEKGFYPLDHSLGKKLLNAL